MDAVSFHALPRTQAEIMLVMAKIRGVNTLFMVLPFIFNCEISKIYIIRIINKYLTLKKNKKLCSNFFLTNFAGLTINLN